MGYKRKWGTSAKVGSESQRVGSECKGFCRRCGVETQKPSQDALGFPEGSSAVIKVSLYLFNCNRL